MVYFFDADPLSMGDHPGYFGGNLPPEEGIKILVAFLLGKRIPAHIDPPPIIFRAPIHDLKELDILPMVGGPPLVNPVVQRTLLALAGDNVEFVPVRIETVDGQLDEYSLLNVAVSVACVDRENAKPRYRNEGSIRGFEPNGCVLFRDCLGDHHIARNADFLPHILVSETLVETFRKEGIRGVYFSEPDAQTDLA